MLCYHLCNSCFVPATSKHPGWLCVHKWKDWICKACDSHLQAFVASTAQMIFFRVTTMSHNTCMINSIILSITSAFTWTKLSHRADEGSMLLQNVATISLSPTYVHKHIIVKSITTKFSENDNRSHQHVTKDAKCMKYKKGTIQTRTI